MFPLLLVAAEVHGMDRNPPRCEGRADNLTSPTGGPLRPNVADLLDQPLTTAATKSVD